MRFLKWLGMGSARLGFMTLVSMVGIFYYTVLHTVAEQDFKLNLPPWGIGGWGEYGRLWDWLNPFFYIQPLYAYNLLIVEILALIPQWYLVRKGKVSKNLFYLNIFTSMIFRASYSNQDVTTTIFAPLASWNPLFTILLILQKAAFGWSLNGSDIHWQYMNDLTQFEPFVWVYLILFFWTAAPALVWLNKKWLHWKLPSFGIMNRIKMEVPKTLKDEVVADIVMIWLAIVVFFVINSIINGGYLLQICHVGQNWDQCAPGIRLPWGHA